MKEEKRNNDFHISAAKVAFKKVANLVATFLNAQNNGCQESSTQVASEKVNNMVGTFSDATRDGFQVSATQAELEKVTDTVGSFYIKKTNLLYYSRQLFRRRTVCHIFFAAFAYLSVLLSFIFSSYLNT